MEIIVGIITALFGLLLIVVLRLVTTLFHELGHAIPALMFTSKKVEVYVGSYGNSAKTLKLNLGRLIMYLKFNLFNWNIGLCRQEEATKKIWQRVLIIIGGPIASLLIAIPIILNLEALKGNSTFFFLAIIFIAAATIDLIVNLIPASQALNMDGGGAAYSDGYQLWAIIQRALLPKEFHELSEKLEAKSYEEVLEITNNLLSEPKPKRYAYDFKIEAHTQLKEYEKAIGTYKLLNDEDRLHKSDYLEVGKLYNKLGDYGEALHFFEHSYKYYYTNPELINAMAHSHIKLGDNRKAIKMLTASLVTAPTYLETYKNRAEAYEKIWEHELAEADLKFIEEAKRSANKK